MSNSDGKFYEQMIQCIRVTPNFNGNILLGWQAPYFSYVFNKPVDIDALDNIEHLCGLPATDIIWPTEEPPVIKPFRMDRTFDYNEFCNLQGITIPEESNTCTCDITALMSVGCKCGQMEKERNAG